MAETVDKELLDLMTELEKQKVDLDKSAAGFNTDFNKVSQTVGKISARVEKYDIKPARLTEIGGSKTKYSKAIYAIANTCYYDYETRMIFVAGPDGKIVSTGTLLQEATYDNEGVSLPNCAEGAKEWVLEQEIADTEVGDLYDIVGYYSMVGGTELSEKQGLSRIGKTQFISGRGRGTWGDFLLRDKKTRLFTKMCGENLLYTCRHSDEARARRDCVHGFTACVCVYTPAQEAVRAVLEMLVLQK